MGLFAGSGLGQMPAACPAPTLQAAQAAGLSSLEAGASKYAKLNHTAGMGGETWHKGRRKKQVSHQCSCPSAASQEEDVCSNTDTQVLAAREPQSKSKEVLVIRNISSLNQVFHCW